MLSECIYTSGGGGSAVKTGKSDSPVRGGQSVTIDTGLSEVKMFTMVGISTNTTASTNRLVSVHYNKNFYNDSTSKRQLRIGGAYDGTTQGYCDALNATHYAYPFDIVSIDAVAGPVVVKMPNDSTFDFNYTWYAE